MFPTCGLFMFLIHCEWLLAAAREAEVNMYRWIALVLVLSLFVGCGGGSETTDQAGSGKPASAPGPISLADRPAREAGRRACAGMEPQEAAHLYAKAALKAGVRKRFADLVTEPTEAIEGSPGYPRLVAALYATTVPEARRAQAAAGCAEELAAH